jgi:hypothetical protein
LIKIKTPNMPTNKDFLKSEKKSTICKKMKGLKPLPDKQLPGQNKGQNPIKAK